MARGNTAQSVSSGGPTPASATSADAKPRPLAAYHKKLKTGERYGRGCWQGSRIFIIVRDGFIIQATLATRRDQPGYGWKAETGPLTLPAAP